MLSAGFRFGQIWSKLKDLLNELERSRIRLAFSRLKGFSWSPIWRPGGRGIEWVNMARSFEALRYIAVCGTNDGPQRKGIEALQTAMEDVQSKLPKIEEQLTELGIRESVQPELQEIRSTMEHIRVRLTSGRASESLQKKAIVVQSTLQDLLQFPEEYATNAAIQFALLKIHSQLRAIHGALALMDAPALTQEKVGDIVEVTSLLRSRKISSPLVHTLREYRQFLKNSTSDDSLAEAFYDLEPPSTRFWRSCRIIGPRNALNWWRERNWKKMTNRSRFIANLKKPILRNNTFAGWRSMLLFAMWHSFAER
jgi:hypothetical protein